MNSRQREFIVGICEKVIIYTLTIALIGRLFAKDVSAMEIVILFLITILIFIIGFYFARKGEEK